VCNTVTRIRCRFHLPTTYSRKVTSALNSDNVRYSKDVIYLDAYEPTASVFMRFPENVSTEPCFVRATSQNYTHLYSSGSGAFASRHHSVGPELEVIAFYAVSALVLELSGTFGM
jgi:hypothetical protein